MEEPVPISEGIKKTLEDLYLSHPEALVTDEEFKAIKYTSELSDLEWDIIAAYEKGRALDEITYKFPKYVAEKYEHYQIEVNTFKKYFKDIEKYYKHMHDVINFLKTHDSSCPYDLLDGLCERILNKCQELYGKKKEYNKFKMED